MGKGMFRVSEQLLPHIFLLPEGARVVNIEMTWEYGYRAAKVYVEHPDLPEPEEAVPWPEVMPTYKRTAQHDHVKFIGWGGQSRIERMIDDAADELKRDAVIDIDLGELAAKL